MKTQKLLFACGIKKRSIDSSSTTNKLCAANVETMINLREDYSMCKCATTFGINLCAQNLDNFYVTIERKKNIIRHQCNVL